MKHLIKAFIISLIISHVICGYDFFDLFDDDCSFFEGVKVAACESIIPRDISKKCSFYNNQCITTYRTCEDYNINVQKEICESINLEYSPDKKCVFENNQCVEKERSCSEFKIGFEAISNCYRLHTNDDNKICIFKNNKCEEQYKKCEDYKDNIQQDICESIQPFDNDDDIIFSKKCVYEDGNCIQKHRFCSEYNYELGIYRYICEELTPSDDSKTCVLVNNKCAEQFVECEYYNGNDKDTCESIQPSNESDKCVLEEGKCISKKKTSCSDYKPGSDEDLCNNIQLEDLAKACVFYNSECIETYKTCEDYQGDNINKEICESIYPTYEKDDNYYLSYTSKCVYDSENKTCMTQIRNCSDSLLDQKQEFCEDLNVVDKKKICAAYNNYCIETYSTCENYTENVEKSKCEAIIPENYYSVKCVYDSENGKCITENLECSSFDIENFKYYCDILGKENNKNCVYSNGFCLEKIPSINFDDTDKETTSINIDDTDKETTNIIIDDSDKKTTNIIIDDTKKETTNNIIDDTKKESTNIIIDHTKKETTNNIIDDTKKESTNIIINDTKKEINTSDLGRIDLPKITLLILCILFE